MRIICEFNSNRRRNYENKETSQKPEEIYSFGKGPDSPGSFRFERTGEINFRILSKNFKTI